MVLNQKEILDYGANAPVPNQIYNMNSEDKSQTRLTSIMCRCVSVDIDYVQSVVLNTELYV